LRALRVSDVDFAAGVISVERGWDPVEGAIELRSRAGRRRVPIAAVLRDHLVEHSARVRRADDELIFGTTAESPFTGNMLQRRADKAWEAEQLGRISTRVPPHVRLAEIAAGVNAKALSSYMGHSSITVTLDLYGHLMPGNESEAAGLLDAYLNAQREQADEQARAAGAEAFA
jgi:integrase